MIAEDDGVGGDKMGAWTDGGAPGVGGSGEAGDPTQPSAMMTLVVDTKRPHRVGCGLSARHTVPFPGSIVVIPQGEVRTTIRRTFSGSGWTWPGVGKKLSSDSR